jgi:hypothetical protein
VVSESQKPAVSPSATHTAVAHVGTVDTHATPPEPQLAATGADPIWGFIGSFAIIAGIILYRVGRKGNVRG